MNVIVHHWQKNKFEFADGSPIPPSPATLHSLKWMPGDVISPCTSCVVKRTCGRVVGIVDVLNRTRFGTTTRGIPLYIMYPIDVRYPPFLVALKTKPSGNIFVVAKYEHWDGVWPRAGFEKQIGIVGNLNSELNALRQTLPTLPTLESMGSGELGDKHACVDWDIVLHIDPPGCKDIDDVLCWKHRADGTVQFAIGIADVGYWIKEDTDVDKSAFERGATLYNEDGVAIEPMFPPELSENQASLRCDGNLRPAVCLTFDLVRDPDGSRGWQCSNRNGQWELHMLRVNESYTYDSIYANSERAEQVRHYLSAICGNIMSVDSHEWIERAMILYNRRVGEELQRHGVGLLRAHMGTTNEEYAALAAETGCREIEWIGSAAGTYVLPSNNTGHNGLRLACYAHASSPLRRYVDLYNQRWIRALFFGFPPPSVTTGATAGEYNMRSKRIRRLEQDMYFLNRVLSPHPGELPSAIGFVLDIKHLSTATSPVLRVFVPEWKRVVSCKCIESVECKKGMRILVRMYLDTRQGDWGRRFIYKGEDCKDDPIGFE